MSESQFNWDNVEAFGFPISGIRVDDNRFVVVTSFSRLESLVSNPLNAVNPRMRGSEPGLLAYEDLHKKIQRGFDAGKRKNVENYAKYIIDLSKGSYGDTPTIDLFTPEQLPVRAGGNLKEKDTLVWPYGLSCVPYDGETQLAARFRAAAMDPSTRDSMLIVTVTHGKDVKHAMQCFGDRNAYQRRASASITMKMNTRDPFVNVVRELEEKIPGLHGAVEWESRQVAGDKIAAASFIRTSVACFASGISGVQSKTDSIPEGLTEKDFTERSVIWFSTVITPLLSGIKDRKNYVTGSPAIWAALGAMGHGLVDKVLTQDDIETVAKEISSQLSDVNWRKSDKWIGIAVKAAKKGYSFAGGAKDSGSIAYRALSDKNDVNYFHIRENKPAQDQI